MFGNWNSPDTVLQAARYATEAREKCIADGRSLLFETVLSAPDKVPFVQRAKQQGYFIRLFFIGTDSPQVNAARVAQRVMLGGHDVPIPKIISRYYKSIANGERLVSVADRLYVCDNSIDNVFPQLLFRTADGELVKRYAPVRDWAKIIFEGVTGCAGVSAK